MNIFKRNSLIFILLVGLVLIVASPKGFAQSFFTTGNPLDTPTDTTYSVLGTQETLDYKDGLLNQRPTTFPAADETLLVTSEVGFSMKRAVVSQSVTPGEVYTHETYSVTNEGNIADSYTVKSVFYERNNADDWTVVLVSAEAPATIATLTPGVLNVYTREVADNEDMDLFYRVIVSDEAAGAPDGSSIEVVTTFEAYATPVGQYTGGNALTYSGTSEADDVFIDTVAAPQMLIERDSVINSPVVYQTNGGGANDPVPGAVVTYTMTYTNEGSAAANNVIIVDRITTKEATPGTNLAHVNATGVQDNVDITAVKGTATGWTVKYATSLTTATTYGATIDWTLIGTVGADEFPGDGILYAAGSSEYGAVLIKWEKESVAVDEDDTLTWGVTIR